MHLSWARVAPMMLGVRLSVFTENKSKLSLVTMADRTS